MLLPKISPLRPVSPASNNSEKVMRTTVIAAVLLLATAIPSAAQQISRDQARSLLQTTLKLRGDKVAPKQIQETTTNIPGYYSFGAYDTRQPSVQNVIGWFAVNKRTGQVWDTTSCELYQFPKLERQRHHLVRHTSKKKQTPPCSEGQKTHIVRKRPVRPEVPEVAQ